MAMSLMPAEIRSKKTLWSEYGFAMLILALVVVGAAIPAIFWGIWYALSGSVPKFLGFSRFWIDTISGALYIPVLVIYIANVSDACDELSEDGGYEYSFWFGLFLAIDFLGSIFWSFATGLAGMAVLAIIIWACFAVRKLFSYLAHRACQVIFLLTGVKIT